MHVEPPDSLAESSGVRSEHAAAASPFASAPANAPAVALASSAGVAKAAVAAAGAHPAATATPVSRLPITLRSPASTRSSGQCGAVGAVKRPKQASAFLSKVALLFEAPSLACPG